MEIGGQTGGETEAGAAAEAGRGKGEVGGSSSKLQQLAGISLGCRGSNSSNLKLQHWHALPAEAQVLRQQQQHSMRFMCTTMLSYGKRSCALRYRGPERCVTAVLCKELIFSGTSLSAGALFVEVISDVSQGSRCAYVPCFIV